MHTAQASRASIRSGTRKGHSRQLAGADLVVLNDNDPAGQEHAAAACHLSLGIAKRVRRLDLAPHSEGMPKGADVSDWLAAGHGRRDIDARIDGRARLRADHHVADAKLRRRRRRGTRQALARLLAPLDYERARKSAGERLGVSRLALLDALVKAKRAELGLDEGGGKQGHADLFVPQPARRDRQRCRAA